MLISDWSADGCASDLLDPGSVPVGAIARRGGPCRRNAAPAARRHDRARRKPRLRADGAWRGGGRGGAEAIGDRRHRRPDLGRSEEHTSELQSLMRISYAVFCLKKKKNTK